VPARLHDDNNYGPRSSPQFYVIMQGDAIAVPSPTASREYHRLHFSVVPFFCQNLPNSDGQSIAMPFCDSFDSSGGAFRRMLTFRFFDRKM
jgi:hypothetical protein